MEKVIVLNSNYEFLNFCDWKRALILVNAGKAEILKESDKTVKNYSGSFKFVVPYVIKLLKLVRSVYKRKVPWGKRNVFIRDNYTCQYCGTTDLKNPDLEHVVPKSRGGKNTFENCVTACRPCNRKKADKLPSEVGMFLLKKPVQPTINEFLINKIKHDLKSKDIIDSLFKDFM